MKRERLPKRLLNEDESLMEPACYVVRSVYPLHWHEFYELEFIIDGEGEHVLNGRTYSLARGDLFLLTPSDFHEIHPSTESGLNLYNVKFSEEAISATVRDLLFEHGDCCMARFEGAQLRRVNAEFERLMEESANDGIGKDLLMKGALERILIDLLRSSTNRTQQGANASIDGSIRKALIYMHHHYREPLTLDIVSGKSGLSPHYFSECFHNATGSSFRTYLQALRLRAAMALVCSSAISVTEICYHCGFNSYTHFIRAFKQKYGLAPNAYRKSLPNKS